MPGSHSHGPFLTVSPVIQPALTCLFSYLSEPADAHTEGSLALGFSLSPLLSTNPSTTLTAPSLLCNGGVTPNYCACLWCVGFLPVLLIAFVSQMNAWVKQNKPPSRHEILISGILSSNPRHGVFFSSVFCPYQQSNKNFHLDSMLFWNLKSLVWEIMLSSHVTRIQGRRGQNVFT